MRWPREDSKLTASMCVMVLVLLQAQDSIDYWKRGATLADELGDVKQLAQCVEQIGVNYAFLTCYSVSGCHVLSLLIDDLMIGELHYRMLWQCSSIS